MEYLNNLPIGAIDRHRARLLLRLKYQEIYGIVDPNRLADDNLPYPLAAIPNLEDMSKHRPSSERLRQYIRERVFHHTGISLEAFKRLPRHQVEMILEEVGKLNKMEDTQSKNMLNAINSVKTDSTKASSLILPNNLRG